MTSLPGLIREAGRIYRKVKTGKIDREQGRSLIWGLSQIRPVLEAQAIKRIEARLEELNAHAEAPWRQRAVNADNRQLAD